MTATETYARPELLVEPDWLVQHLDDPNVVIIDCDRPEMRGGRGIIPNARILPIHPYFRNTETGVGVATAEQTQTILRALGVNDDSKVVAYDSEGSLLAARLWWVLWYHGFENVAVLNGGWPAWIAARYPTSRQHPDVSPGNVTLTNTDEERIAACDVILPGLQSGDIVPLDVRAPEEWSGEKPAPNESNKREGRIPGAIHIEWREFIDWENATRFKPAAEINRILESRGVPRDKKIVPY
ncbi:MAG TPA: rhodanese-like domain-containing protein [Thermomicrobiales bacterium]|nr:rhodanese-like domain-containing protein [Thermomicrobiales bacterium]